jgi:hypothetical protein
MAYVRYCKAERLYVLYYFEPFGIARFHKPQRTGSGSSARIGNFTGKSRPPHLAVYTGLSFPFSPAGIPGKAEKLFAKLFAVVKPFPLPDRAVSGCPYSPDIFRVAGLS